MFVTVARTALKLDSERSVIDQVLSVAGFTTGMILGLFILGTLRRPVQSGAALVGLVAGFLAVLSVWLPSTLPPPWGRVIVAWPWYAPIGTGVTVAVALIVDRLRNHARSSANGGA